MVSLLTLLFKLVAETDKMQAFNRLTTPTLERSRLTAGNGCSFLIDEQRSLWASGDNSRGRLGLGDLGNRSRFTRVQVTAAVQVSVGGTYTAIITESGELWIAGSNDPEDLHCNFTLIALPQAVKQVSANTQQLALLTESGELWLADLNKVDRLELLAYKHFVQSELPEPVSQLSVGHNYDVAVVTSSGQLWVCGDNAYGQLGLSGDKDRDVFTRVELPERVKRVSVGFHSVLVTESGQLWVCGYNEEGQLGLGDWGQRNVFTRVELSEPVEQASVGIYHTVVLTTSGRLLVCGSNMFKRLTARIGRACKLFTRIEMAETVTEVSTSYQHTILLTSSGRFYGCGYNGSGALGCDLYTVTELSPLTL